VLDEEIAIAGRSYRFYAATVGNPHCVLPLKKISPELARELGPQLETHPLFPNRTNVQLLQVLDRNNIRIEIWERGAGYTLASGSSSCAAAAVARKMGACDGDITVHMPGGKLRIQVADDYSITMTGPATRVGEFFLDAEALK
jgi:diaminopimelate epimerase